MIAYLAHSLDNGSSEQEARQARVSLLGQGYTVFDPGYAWEAGSPAELDPQLMWANLRVLKEADVVVVVLTRGVLTIGSIVELVFKQAQAPRAVAVYGPTLGPSVALTALGVPLLRDQEELETWLRDYRPSRSS